MGGAPELVEMLKVLDAGDNDIAIKRGCDCAQLLLGRAANVWHPVIQSIYEQRQRERSTHRFYLANRRFSNIAAPRRGEQIGQNLGSSCGVTHGLRARNWVLHPAPTQNLVEGFIERAPDLIRDAAHKPGIVRLHIRHADRDVSRIGAQTGFERIRHAGIKRRSRPWCCWSRHVISVQEKTSLAMARAILSSLRQNRPATPLFRENPLEARA